MDKSQLYFMGVHWKITMIKIAIIRAVLRINNAQMVCLTDFRFPASLKRNMRTEFFTIAIMGLYNTCTAKLYYISQSVRRAQVESALC
jgi:hypothetical protein